jgi:hypothetical protein
VPNESEDPFWRKEPSQYLLVECKNWSVKTAPDELDRFYQKLERRHQRCRLGFYVAPAGFTAGVESTLTANRKEANIVVPIGDEELRSLVEAGGGVARNDLLKPFHQRAVIKG